MRQLFGLLIVVGTVGCTQLNTRAIVIDGKTVGHIATYHSTPDFGGWISGAALYDTNGKLLDHRSVGATGLLPAVIQGGSIVGAATMFGHSMPKEGVTNLNNEQQQQQDQQQKTSSAASAWSSSQIKKNHGKH